MKNMKDLKKNRIGIFRVSRVFFGEKAVEKGDAKSEKDHEEPGRNHKIVYEGQCLFAFLVTSW